MLGLSIPVALMCIGIVFVGSAIQASIGIGLGMLAAPFLTLVDPSFVPVAIVICVVPLTGFNCDLKGFRVTLLESDEARFEHIFTIIRDRIREYLASA